MPGSTDCFLADAFDVESPYVADLPLDPSGLSLGDGGFVTAGFRPSPQPAAAKRTKCNRKSGILMKRPCLELFVGCAGRRIPHEGGTTNTLFSIADRWFPPRTTQG